MRIILYVLLSVIALLFAAIYLLTNIENTRLTHAYGREAVKALAMDAASTFPTIEPENGDHQFWPPKTTPCVFTTNVAQVKGNGTYVSWENWPSGAVASCRDFYVAETGVFDRKTTLPQQCLPALTFADKGGPAMRFLAVVADGAEAGALKVANLSLEKRNRLAKLGNLSHFYYTDNFIRGGGLDGVSVELIETEACDGFSIFRFQTNVDDPENLRSQLDANGYFVGMK